MLNGILAQVEAAAFDLVRRIVVQLQIDFSILVGFVFSRLDHLNRELAIDADWQRLQRQPARLNRVCHDPPVQTPA
ncbi:hypothetical protein D3C78_1920430 [compost metagenome]